MSLFQQSVLNKYLEQLDDKVVNAGYERLKAFFFNADIQKNIDDAKEEQFQEGFLRELFVKIFGYTINPEPNFNLTTEFKNQTGSKKADGAILKDGKAIAVIELKGTDTPNLDKVHQQAFNYKNNQTACEYVIISNFSKLRFFIHDAVDYLEFNLFNLSFDNFKVLWLCLHKNNIYADLPKRIKEESISEEEKITKEFYSDYSVFKKELYEDLVKKNPELNKLLLYQKTQKLLDRLLFIFFAEDKLLLPPNSIKEIIKQWEQLSELDEARPLYDRLKKYFGYMNTGHKGKEHDIFAYNGGLFQADEVLDKVLISDETLKNHLVKIATYDFGSEVDVNILGHIFEHSLAEIENKTAELEGREHDKAKSKRKKDGIFYTPKYITKYIVENTVGKLCEEKKTELGIIAEEFAKGRKYRKKETIKALDDKLKQYRKWLLGITICDPACGSGAFLNQALDFLIKEHHAIDELHAVMLGGAIVFRDVENHILENNIYGVDINEESTEIAKLSLWLRTAQKGRKLSSLNNNIRCGNSLIDDAAVAGEKAFNWEKEFADVFANGGFDVVIGNPPYGMIQDKKSKEYFKNAFKSFQGNLENYCFFTERFVQLSKPDSGNVGLIIPVTWISIPQFENLRKIILSYKINSIVELPMKVFSDADLDTLIFVINKKQSLPTNEVSVVKVESPDSISFEKNVSNPIFIKQIKWIENNDSRIDLTYDDITDGLLYKILKKTEPLKTHFEVSQGIVPYAREELYKSMDKEKADEIVDKRLWHSDTKKDSTFKKELKGEDITRYSVKWNGVQWVKYGEWLARPRSSKYFNSPRVLVREITRGTKLNAGYTEEESYNNPGIINIISGIKNDEEELLKGLLAIINSSFIFYYHLKTSPKAKLKTSIPKILIKDVENLPIPHIDKIFKSKLYFKTEEMIALINKFQLSYTQLTNLLQNKITMEKLSTKLQDWYKLEFKEFLNELKKAKVKLSLAEEADWMNYFNAEKQKALQLQSEIEKTDKEIDRMVYELYELTEEEIKIVEGNAIT